MNARYLFVCTLLLFAHGAYGDGRYQRTKDGTTLVWNNHPEPGDAATWSGNRTKDGYATGHGTLTWYKTGQVHVTGSNIRSVKHAPASRYSGKMIRGKFEGRVATVDGKGNTFHVTFVKGKARDWDTGADPSSPRDESARLVDRTGVASDQPGDGRVARAELIEEPPAPGEGPMAAPKTARPSTDTSRSGVDDSLRSLISPPSLIRMGAVAEPPTPKATVEPAASPQTSPPATVPAPSAPPRAVLTTSEVITLADAEARTQGYNLGEYQRPQAQYTAADDTWSVSYDQKYIDGLGEIGKRFSVTVEDKSKKTSITVKR